MITQDSLVVASRDQIAADVADGIVLLGIRNGIYYGLNTVGAYIWNLIQEPKRIWQLRDMIAAEYEVEAERCEADVISLLEKLLAEGLVEVK